MRYNCYYDELRDKGTAVGGLEFDLANAIENDTVESFQANLDYNGFESVDDIDGQCVSVFEALKLAKAKAIDMAKSSFNNGGGATAPIKGSEASPASAVTEGEAA